MCHPQLAIFKPSQWCSFSLLPVLGTFFCACASYTFPALGTCYNFPAVTCFHAHCAREMFPACRAAYRFPAVCPSYYFLALDTGYSFPRVCHRSHIFPRLAPVNYFSRLVWFKVVLTRVEITLDYVLRRVILKLLL